MDMPKYMVKRIEKYKIPCKGYQVGNPLAGYDWDCEYDNAADVTCDDCICNGGSKSPITGKRVYKKQEV